MLFLDSAEPREIRDLFAWGVVSGVTTDPVSLARGARARDLETRIREVVDASWGSVSVELTVETEDEMLREAITYHSWDPERVCVKVPFSEIGLRVLHQLSERGVSTSMTSLQSFNQAYLAALAGADFVNLSCRDMGPDSRSIVRETRAILDREKLPAKIVVGSVLQLLEVNEALQDGAHIVTVSPPILRKMLGDPRASRVSGAP